MHRLISIILLAVLAFPALAQPPASCTLEEAETMTQDMVVNAMDSLVELERRSLGGDFPTTLKDTWIEWMILYANWRAVIEPALPDCAEIAAVKTEMSLMMADYVVMLGLTQGEEFAFPGGAIALDYIADMMVMRSAANEGFLAAFRALFAIPDRQ